MLSGSRYVCLSSRVFPWVWTVQSFLLASFLYLSLITDLICPCMAHLLVSLCSLRYERWGCNTSYQIDLSPHYFKFNFTWQLIVAGYEGGRIVFYSVRKLSLWSAALPAPKQTWDKPVLQANSHKGELCKTEGWRDGKGRFIHLFLNVFVGVVCIVLFNQYVPLLITSDQFFQRYRNSCSFKCTNGNEPNISALDTVT